MLSAQKNIQIQLGQLGILIRTPDDIIKHISYVPTIQQKIRSTSYYSNRNPLKLSNQINRPIKLPYLKNENLNQSFQPLEVGENDISHIKNKNNDSFQIEINNVSFSLNNQSKIQNINQIILPSPDKTSTSVFRYRKFNKLAKKKIANVTTLDDSIKHQLRKQTPDPKKSDSPTRRYCKPENSLIIQELLGAGTDPLARESEYSFLAGNPKKLINATFVKPVIAKVRFPPVLDSFSRTIGAPIACMGLNVTPSQRIGSNYTESARLLYLDSEEWCVKSLKVTANHILFYANEEYLQIPATLEEELLYHELKMREAKQNFQKDKKKEIIWELEQKVKAKQMCYERYQNYIQKEISKDFVASMRQYWIDAIFELIPGSFNLVSKSTIGRLIDEMLSEINQMYYNSIRKAILDYILLSQQEKLRIGIMQVFDPVEIYGYAIYKGIEASEQWKQRNREGKQQIINNLQIFNNATLQIMHEWYIEFKPKIPLLDINQNKDVQDLATFIENNQKLIIQAKELIKNEWNNLVVDIYKKVMQESGNLNNQTDENDEEEEESIIKGGLNEKKTKKNQLGIFFDQTAILLSNLLRQHVEEYTKMYCQLFQKFDIENIKDVEDILEDEKKDFLQCEYYNVFLKVNVINIENRIDFEDDLEFIKDELLNILFSLLQVTHKIARPEHTLVRNDKQDLQFINLTEGEEEDIYISSKQYISNIIDNNIEIIEQIIPIFGKYEYLLQAIDNEVLEFVDSFPKREEYLKQLKMYEDIQIEMENELPFFIRTNMILVDCVKIKNTLIQKTIEIRNFLMKSIKEYTNSQIYKLDCEIGKLLSGISKNVDSTQTLVQLEGEISHIKENEQRRIMTEYKDVCQWMLFQIGKQTKIDNEELNKLNKLSKNVFQMMDQVEQQEERIKNQKEQIEEDLSQQRDEFNKQIKEFHNKIDSLKEYGSIFMVQEVTQIINEQNDILEQLLQEKQQINNDEELLLQNVSEFTILDEAIEKLQPYKELWSLVSSFTQNISAWTKDSSIFKLDPETIEKDTKQMFQTSMKLNIFFNPHLASGSAPPKKQTGPQKLINQLVQEVKEFQTQVPIVRALCNEGLKPRHWENISKILGFPISSDKEFTLKRLVDMEVADHLPHLEEISDSASKEYAIEKIMNKMKDDWQQVEVELKEWKDTKTQIVSGSSIDEIQQILDDQIVKTQTMKSSTYAAIFYNKIIEWENWLQYTLLFSELWTKVQQVWIYLEPIFSSPDILKRLPYEGSIFREVDQVWRALMSEISYKKKVLDFTQNSQLIEDLKVSNQKLEIVQKGLNAYLEGKRAGFPRFYFLSNDELLEILSETKDPLRVQAHLKKCFEGIQKLKFDATKKVLGMYSTEEEYVEFLTQVDTANAQGNVEEWLLQVEYSMVESVRYNVEQSYEAYMKMNRNQWVLDRCGQSVLNMSMTFWTYETEKAIMQQNLNEHLQYLSQSIIDIVSLVRQDISKLNRCTIEALIVLDVHNKDVVQNLCQSKISQREDFAWQSQLRYYWLEQNTQVKIINAIVVYNYEYLGNSPRLVITPLTDRCYRTLCGAIHLNYGGAPEGPAGTGKTETVKDLAKALARQCVVFNCSDGLDYKAMGKFFKGLASSGAWSCFDEFNRIDLEVLSVVAQQILTIQLARAKNVEKFIFEGSTIPLKTTCNVFITMNPGYAGRSELPDNLKSLFRSVAMMVPDYALISEIVLYSYGFEDARNLARKIVTTYKLCSEQLSSQDHYDYGMRAVKSVLTAAGNLKRKFSNENESILMLRAISDVNLAKFLAFDLPLFKGITHDLFPNCELPPIDYSQIFNCIDEALNEENLQKVPYFVEKIIQLYEMILVRHGLMVVGLPFSAKSSIIKILSKALTKLKEKNQMQENSVEYIVINPKSIPMKYLYGFNDEISHEWTDGVLAVKYRKFAKSENDERKWLIFDGPVDAVWIENMNTVLDDNKKLCLMSGEIISMTKQMNLIFEPMDLQAASPATVSRCGMIYMEPSSMGWEPMFESWKNCLKHLKEEDFEELNILFNTFINPGLQWIRSKGVEISPTINQNLVLTLIRIMGFMLEDLNSFTDQKIRIYAIDMKFFFAFIWSIGGSLSTECRKQFDIFTKKIASGDIQIESSNKKKVSLPERSSLYDYQLINKEQISSTGKKVFTPEWVFWVDTIKQETIQPKALPQEILIQTADTRRYTFLLQKAIYNQYPLLFCGSTGTGKSTYIKHLLNNNQIFDPSQYLTIEICFSAQTSCTQTQDIVDQKMDRKRKGIYGPKVGKAVIFVDDLNMPQKEQWGAQPPLEILRQYLDQGGWYDNKDKEKQFKNIVDTTLISAMGPPGGGRTFISARVLRHFSLVSLANFDDESLIRIYGQILEWHFKKGMFNPDIQKYTNKIILQTIEIYKLAICQLLPTPTKSHYLFNLRDFSKVIFGICMTDKEKLQTVEQLIRLWTHEVWRVFADRLVSIEDKSFLLIEVKKIISRISSLNVDNIFAHLCKKNSEEQKLTTPEQLNSLIWTDVLSSKKLYEEVFDQEKLQNQIEQSLVNYNLISDKPMQLVLFNFAISHLLIICRILKTPGGNALLVGIGGSGRQSLTRLGASINDFQVMQIEISKQYTSVEFHDDLKKILKNAGMKLIPTVFLFTDSQIKYESFIEDINNLLNTAEVPNLFGNEEKAEIQANCKFNGTPSQMYAYFIDQIKKYLHIVLCFSPIGNAFRNRVRMFPSLVNCCTIDWFQEWPQEALRSVAQRFISNIQMELHIKDDCVDLLQYFHQSTMQWSQKFYLTLKRQYYVTPTSYIEMIMSFKQLLEEKRSQVSQNQHKYERGFEQIIQTEKNITKMQADLESLQPLLKQAAIDTGKKEAEVAEQAKEADVLKKITSEEEAIVKVAVDEASEIQAECEKDLSEAMPILQAAENALKILDKSSVEQLKAMKNPPAPVKAVMQALCLILYPNPVERKKNNETLKSEIDWWAASLKLLGDPQLINRLFTFDKDNVDEKIIITLGKYLKDPINENNLNINTVQNASTACKCIIMWINGIYSYYFVYKKVKPKKIALKQAEDKVNALNQQLFKKQKELKEANAKVEKLNNELENTRANKLKLQTRYQECEEQLDRAQKLILSLGGEKDRWSTFAQQLKKEYTKLTGDVLISAAIVSYLGAFTSAFRSQIIIDWLNKNKTIPSSENFSLTQILGDSVQIRSWNIDGLPSDQFSIENGLIIQHSRRWSLCIDPQNQANKWIKRMESKKNGICIIKLSDNDYLRTLENAIQFGKAVLLENVPEELDPALTPILLKQTYVKGSTIYIKLGDQTLEYSKDFKLYITTKLRNPHYLPEVSTKVTLINFMITYEGLNDQLLGILVKKERPDLEEEKEKLIIDSANNKAQLFDIEERILKVLSSDKNILTDEVAIKILTASKEKSDEIKEKQAIAEETEQNIDRARQQYQDVSSEASHLFFCISDLVAIDPMYQYSLTYYIDLFSQAITKSPKCESIQRRLYTLKQFFLYSLYTNICRSLFEKDKLLFSFLLTTRLQQHKKLINQEHFRFLLTGGLALDEKLPEFPYNTQKWLTNKSWGEIYRLSQLIDFKDFYMTFYDYTNEWKQIYDSLSPQTNPLPKQIGEKYQNDFYQLLILRVLRPDKLIPAIMNYIDKNLSKKFVEPPPFDLQAAYNDSNNITPLIFILSPGSDPFTSLNNFADQKQKTIQSISLGQGQGPAAHKMIQQGQKQGNWVVLQNCHLAVTWMPTLEKIIEDLNPFQCDQDFRLWLTSYPSDKFPTSILQASIKITTEAPKGLKQNILGSYLTDPISREDFFDSCINNQNGFKSLLFGLCFFHAVIQERRKYGSLGWNIPYEFNESDLRISVRQLHMFVLEQNDDDLEKIPFAAIKYLTAECNYGGRVTDDKDRRLINTLLDDYYNKNVIEDPFYSFGPNQTYKVPHIDSYQETIEYIQSFSIQASPEVFGFHQNADITKDINETTLFFDSLLLCTNESGSASSSQDEKNEEKGGQNSQDEALNKLVDSIISDFPNEYDVEGITIKYPVIYTESMNTVLTQELNRFNKLINIIRSSLKDIKLALQGKILLSQSLEKASKQIYDGKVPNIWMEKSYPSLKPLGSYINDLKQRLKFFQEWVDNGPPVNFWISGFFFTQSFLTGVLQNFARKYTIPIDEIEFDFKVQQISQQKEKPEDGAYIYGLFIEGAKWNPLEMELDESDPKILFVNCPTILLLPSQSKKLQFFLHYNSPVYKTSARRGTLSTTGHSTNFVMWIRIPSSKQQQHWVKRGVALLTQLDD